MQSTTNVATPFAIPTLDKECVAYKFGTHGKEIRQAECGAGSQS